MAYSRSLVASRFGRGWWDTVVCPSSIYDQDFGTELLHRDIYPQMSYRGCIRRPRTRAAVQSSGESEVKNEKDKFQVTLSVRHFKPNEIEVKVVDSSIVIHGKHEEISDDFGFIQREFTRRYMLPVGIEAQTVKSSVSADGVLTIEAPKYVIEASAYNERVIPILLSSKASEEKISG